MKQRKKRSPGHDITAAKDRAVKGTLAVSLTVLKDKMGFDNDMICDYLAHFIDLSQSIHDGYVNIADLYKVLREEYQIDFRETGLKGE